MEEKIKLLEEQVKELQISDIKHTIFHSELMKFMYKNKTLITQGVYEIVETELGKKLNNNKLTGFRE